MRFPSVVISFLALASVVFAACIHSDYLGKSYPSTEAVDLFLDEADVRTDYEVMGEVTLETESGLDFAVSSADMQEKALEIAREKGADAVVLGSLQKKATGETTSSSPGPGRTTTSETEIKESKMVKAKLLKYRKNLPGGAADGN